MKTTSSSFSLFSSSHILLLFILYPISYSNKRPYSFMSGGSFFMHWKTSLQWLGCSLQSIIPVCPLQSVKLVTLTVKLNFFCETGAHCSRIHLLNWIVPATVHVSLRALWRSMRVCIFCSFLSSPLSMSLANFWPQKRARKSPRPSRPTRAFLRYSILLPPPPIDLLLCHVIPFLLCRVSSCSFLRWYFFSLTICRPLYMCGALYVMRISRAALCSHIDIYSIQYMDNRLSVIFS